MYKHLKYNFGILVCVKLNQVLLVEVGHVVLHDAQHAVLKLGNVLNDVHGQVFRSLDESLDNFRW